jgi:hypothetical protein
MDTKDAVVDSIDAKQLANAERQMDTLLARIRWFASSGRMTDIFTVKTKGFPLRLMEDRTGIDYDNLIFITNPQQSSDGTFQMQLPTANTPVRPVTPYWKLFFVKLISQTWTYKPLHSPFEPFELYIDLDKPNNSNIIAELNMGTAFNDFMQLAPTRIKYRHISSMEGKYRPISETDSVYNEIQSMLATCGTKPVYLWVYVFFPHWVKTHDLHPSIIQTRILGCGVTSCNRCIKVATMTPLLTHVMADDQVDQTTVMLNIGNDNKYYGNIEVLEINATKDAHTSFQLEFRFDDSLHQMMQMDNQYDHIISLMDAITCLPRVLLEQIFAYLVSQYFSHDTIRNAFIPFKKKVYTGNIQLDSTLLETENDSSSHIQTARALIQNID